MANLHENHPDPNWDEAGDRKRFEEGLPFYLNNLDLAINVPLRNAVIAVGVFLAACGVAGYL